MGASRFSGFLMVMGMAGAFSLSSAISLGGIEVPKDSFIVFLGIGHSNFCGRNIRSADSVADPHAWNYRWHDSSKWVPAREFNGGTSVGGYAIGYHGLTERGTGGPSMPFLKGLAKAYPGYHFGIITNAASTSTARITYIIPAIGFPDDDINTYWKDGGGNRYKEITAAALKVKPDVTLAGIIGMFGLVEAYGAEPSDIRRFKSDLAKIISDMRSDLGLPNLPFLIGHYESGATGPYSPTDGNGLYLVNSIDSLPFVLSNCDVINDSGCAMLDDHHYSTAGQNEWAARAVALIAKHKWVPTAVIKAAGHNNVAAPSPRIRVLDHGGDGRISIEFSFPARVRNPAVAIFSATGEIVKGNSRWWGNEIDYDLEHSSPGLYFARITVSGKTFFRQVPLVH